MPVSSSHGHGYEMDQICLKFLSSHCSHMQWLHAALCPLPGDLTGSLKCPKLLVCLLPSTVFHSKEGDHSSDTMGNIFVVAAFFWTFYFVLEYRWCYENAALNMPENLENSAVATGLENVRFHSNPKERQCQRMLKLPHNCTHLTRSKVMLKLREPWTSRCPSWI